MRLFLVKVKGENGRTKYWPESLNRECAQALVDLLREQGKKAKIVTVKVPVRALTSLQVRSPSE